MSNTIALPERFNIECVEAVHAEVRVRPPGVLLGDGVKSIDGAALQWLAAAVRTGWSVTGASDALKRGVASLGLEHTIKTNG
jgi:hypothetical protein